MSILSAIKGWISMFLKSRAKEEFNIEPICSADLDKWVAECVNIYMGNPSWLDPDDHIDTVNFAKSVCTEVSRLTTLGIKVTVGGSARADWLQSQVENVYFRLREWVEYSCAYGTVALKPNGNTIDLYAPGEFEVTHIAGGKIDGAVFYNRTQVGNLWYTRLEYHRFENNLYRISNKCYVGKSPNDMRDRIDISLTPWAGLTEETAMINVEQPLFGVLRTPHANNIDLGSPMGLPVFSEAVQELRDLDIAYSRNSKEITDSKRTVLLDSDAMISSGTKIGYQAEITLPDYVKNVYGSGDKTFYQEINPTLNTDVRLTGINALLSQIGYKIGFSNGYFVFNEKTGMVTATQVESDDRRTLQFVKDMRDKLEDCMGGLIYALNVFADLYDYAPAGDYEVVFDFGDITYNREEDRARVWGQVVAGYFPYWRYLTKFEGYSEDEAKEIAAEGRPKTPALFE